MTSPELVALAQKGERDAFGELYRRNYGFIVRFIFGRTGDRDLAQEIASQAFLAAFQRLEKLREYEAESAFARWMTTISKNLLVNHCRSSYRQHETPVDEFLDATLDAPQPDRVVEYADFQLRLTNTLASAIDKLSESQQTALRLRYEEELSFTDVSSRMGKKETAAKALVHRALGRLRKHPELLELYGDCEHSA